MAWQVAAGPVAGGSKAVRASVVGVLLLFLLAAGGWALWRMAVPTRPVGGPDSSAAKAAALRQEAVSAALHEWSRARAEAWASGDPARLRTLYAGRSAVGDLDVARLTRWHKRGFVVENMSTQVLATQVRSFATDRIVVEVTDRISSAVAVGPTGARQPLPRDRATTSVVTLVRRDGGWLLASSRALSR